MNYQITLYFLLLITITSCNNKAKQEDDIFKNKLQYIEDKLSYCPQEVVHIIDSINNNNTTELKEKHAGQLAYINGLLAYKKGEMDSSLVYLEEGLSHFTKQNNKNGQAKCNLILGWVAEGTYYWEQAITNYYNAIRLSGNNSGRIKGLAYMGLYRCKSNVGQSAKEDLKKGIEILYETNIIEHKLYADYIESISKNNKETPIRLKAIAEKYIEIGLNRKVITIYKSLTGYYIDKHQTDSALLYADKALKLPKDSLSGVSLVSALVHMKGIVFFQKRDYDRARQFFLDYLDKERLNKGSSKYYGYDYLHRIDTIQGNYKRAVFYQTKAYDYKMKSLRKDKQTMAKMAEIDTRIFTLKQNIKDLKYRKYINILLYSSSLLFLFGIGIWIYSTYRNKQRKVEGKNRIMKSLLVGLGEKQTVMKHFNLINDTPDTPLPASIETKEEFDLYYTGTLLKFQKEFTSLTTSEVRYAAMFGMELPVDIIANINNVQPAAIRKNKQRIRIKLALDANCDLQDYFSQHITNNQAKPTRTI